MTTELDLECVHCGEKRSKHIIISYAGAPLMGNYVLCPKSLYKARPLEKPVMFRAGRWASENDDGWGVYRSDSLKGGGRSGGIVQNCRDEAEARRVAQELQNQYDAEHPENTFQ